MIYKTRLIRNNLDILLLTYNCIENTKRCIDDLYAHTKNFSLTIVDNGSTDGSIDFLKCIADHNSNITLDLQKENLGIIKGRNLAYEISRDISPSTDYIMFMDNDQFVCHSWKEVYMELMGEGYDIIGAEAWKMDHRFMPKRKCSQLTDEFNYVGCGGMMIKHYVINDIGLFDEQFIPMYFEDPNFCWEAYNAGYKIAWVGNDIICHNHKGSLLNNTTKKYFHNSHKKFRSKWNGCEIPVFKNPNIISVKI